MERAESAAVGLAAHPLVGNAKLISEMERGWQEKSAELMASAISAAKKVRLDKALVKVYAQRYKQLAIEEKLKKGIAGDIPLLHAACEQAKLIGYDGPVLADAEAKLKKYKSRKTTGALLMDDNAVGARKFGSWRENPTWKITVQKKTTVFIAVNEVPHSDRRTLPPRVLSSPPSPPCLPQFSLSDELPAIKRWQDGELDAASQAKLEAKKAKKAAQYEKAKDKMVATQVSTSETDSSSFLPVSPSPPPSLCVTPTHIRSRSISSCPQEAADGDAKNDELAAAAKDAARVFKELDDAKKRKAQKEADGEEDNFSRLGIHVVQNSRPTPTQDSNGRRELDERA